MPKWYTSWLNMSQAPLFEKHYCDMKKNLHARYNRDHCQGSPSFNIKEYFIAHCTMSLNCLLKYVPVTMSIFKMDIHVFSWHRGVTSLWEMVYRPSIGLNKDTFSFRVISTRKKILIKLHYNFVCWIYFVSYPIFISF